MLLKVNSKEGEKILEALNSFAPMIFQIVGEEHPTEPLPNVPPAPEPKPEPVKPVEPPKPEPKPEPVKPTGTLWEQLIASVKASAMTNEMKIACVAQAIIESGRGTSRVTNECRNFWGIKMRPELNGLAVPREVKVTSEVEGKAIFAEFKNTDDAVKGWLKFLTRSYYKGWEVFATDSEKFMRHIGKSWCPRADYADEVIRLMPEARKLLAIQVIAPAKKVRKTLTDPGHSEQRVGARSSKGAEEEDLNRLQAAIFQKAASEAGHIVDIFDPLVDNLVQIGQKAKNYDAFISWHHNSYAGTSDPGVEVFVTTYASDEQEAIAKKVCDAIAKELAIPNRGVKRKNWTVINEADKLIDGPVMLIESYFLNPYTPKEAEERSTRAAKVASAVLVDWMD